MATWKKLLREALEGNGETADDFVATTLTEEELNREFDPGFGGAEGTPFTLWTKTRVYFPAVYDGSEWVAWVPRNPNGKPTHHIGGE